MKWHLFCQCIIDSYVIYRRSMVPASQGSRTVLIAVIWNWSLIVVRLVTAGAHAQYRSVCVKIQGESLTRVFSCHVWAVMVLSSQPRGNLPGLCYSHTGRGSVVHISLVLSGGYKNGHQFVDVFFELMVLYENCYIVIINPRGCRWYKVRDG